MSMSAMSSTNNPSTVPGPSTVPAGIFDLAVFDQHELVQFCRDPDAGLTAIIAVHSTALGPAAGGCRMWPYASAQAAVEDVLRLSRGMSYKNAMADLPLGGGKAVIIADPHTDKSPALFKAFGRFVDSLGGRYITAEDVGVTVDDMEIVATETRHVVGRKIGKAAAGDPSPWTARGVLRGIETAVRHRLRRESLAGLTIAVQGVGHVGFALAEMLKEAGATLIVSDVHAPNVARAVAELGARALEPDQILAAEADVFAPCALGAIIDDAALGRLRAPIVAGAANNQLARPEHGEALRRQGVLYAPDYVINAGGIISVAGEIGGEIDRRTIPARVDQIAGRLDEIFRTAAQQSEPTDRVADRIAERIIAAGRARKTAGVAQRAAR